MNDLCFQPAEEGDLSEILDIYNHYILTTTATFREQPISMETLKTFIFLHHPRYGVYVIRHSDDLAGFCFLTQYRNLPAYDRTSEVGLYLKPEFTRRGLGAHAVKYLEQVAAENGIKMLIASISGENTPSLKLFRKLGYVECGRFKRVGEKWGRAIDVIYFQRSLETDSVTEIGRT